jgi:hypothetical protein
MYNFRHVFSHVSDGFNALHATLAFLRLSFALHGPLKNAGLRFDCVYIYIYIFSNMINKLLQFVNTLSV